MGSSRLRWDYKHCQHHLQTYPLPSMGCPKRWGRGCWETETGWVRLSQPTSDPQKARGVAGTPSHPFSESASLQHRVPYWAVRSTVRPCLASTQLQLREEERRPGEGRGRERRRGGKERRGNREGSRKEGGRPGEHLLPWRQLDSTQSPVERCPDQDHFMGGAISQYELSSS